tara:strand:- start:289 stop:573 length:285 start_codon:yes stop_codon:yes gene_type:complete
MALPDGLDPEVVIGYLIFGILSVIVAYYLGSDFYIWHHERKQRKIDMTQKKKKVDDRKNMIKMKKVIRNRDKKRIDNLRAGEERIPNLYAETKL